HDALHVVQVERLVVVVEVHPAGLASDVVLPLARVAEHGGAAGVVELRDAHRLDLALVRDPELPLGLDLGGQPVAVPAEAALDAPAPHGLVARDDVLDVTGQEVAVVRQPVGERRAVVEHELVGAVLAGGALLDAGLEGAVGLPVLEDLLLELGERRPGRDLLCGARLAHASLRVRHTVFLAVSSSSFAPATLAGARTRGRCARPRAPAVPPRLPALRPFSLLPSRGSE